MNDEQILEKKILEKELTAPRITPELVDAAIASEEYYVFDTSCLTICVLTLKNGFTVSGDSPLVSIENYDPEIGREVSKAKARNKIWQLLGFLLQEKLSGSNLLGDIDV